MMNLRDPHTLQSVGGHFRLGNVVNQEGSRHATPELEGMAKNDIILAEMDYLMSCLTF